jgi:predicted acyltransferase
VYKNLVYFIDNRLTGSTSRWGYLYTIITSIAVIIYGSIISKLLMNRTSHRQFMKTLALLGAIGVISGLALHPVIPIIKRMFTSSYTLFTCGLMTFILLLFYWLIDVRGYRRWSFPFVVFGMNSIFVYMLNGLFREWLLGTSGIFIEPLGVIIGVWVFPLEHTVRLLAEWLTCFWLYRRKIFIKI